MSRYPRIRRFPRTRSLFLSLGVLGVSVTVAAAPVLALADQPPPPSSTQAAQTSAGTTTTGPSSPSSTASGTTSTSGTTTTPGAQTETTTSTTSAPEVPAPEVHTQTAQPVPVPRVHRRAPSRGHGRANGKAGAHSAPGPNHVSALPPSALKPLPPSALGAGAGVSNFFVTNFAFPPFLLPIYRAAAAAYGIPWQVLAAINEVETDYGRDLSLSSAGAEGWMQFLPSSWAQYGVDANGAGYADPYNPADAIFAAARYLKAAGGARDLRGAIFAYNHSQSYVASVLLRAQLLGATPPELLDSLVSLTEARFPVHAPAHFSDGFPTVTPAGRSARTLVATTVYSKPDAPVIAVQDGVVAAIGDSPTLGRYVVLRDAYGNTYTYGQLGSVAALYPVLKPHHAALAAGVREVGQAHARSVGAAPIPPASAGVQPRSLLSAGAVSSALALGAAAELEDLPDLRRARAHARRPRSVLHASVPVAVFRAGAEDVYLHALAVGAHVIAGTVIGHLGAAASEVTALLPPISAPPAGSAAPVPAPAASGEEQAHMLFQVRPAGTGAPLIDPKPFLDGWVRLQGSLLYHLTGRHRFPAATASTVSSVHCTRRCTPAQAASAPASVLTPGQWLALDARLGQIPDPVVASTPSAAAIPDHPASTGPGGAAPSASTAGEGQ